MHKVLAYVTRWRSGKLELLVFTQPAWQDGQEDPGTQVPAGTVDGDETPEQAILREVWEEAGLSGLTIAAKLGELYQEQWSHTRHIFHLPAPDGLPEAWDHIVTGQGLDCGWTFRYRFVPLEELPRLAAEQGNWLDELRQHGAGDWTI